MSLGSRLTLANSSAENTMKNGLIGTSAFQRSMNDYNAATDGELLSDSRFNLIMGGCLLWGFLINALICTLFGHQISALVEGNAGVALGVILGYFVFAFGGTYICHKSKKPAISFLGYNLIVLPMGIMLSVILTAYPVMTISYAFAVTAVVTFACIVISTAKPDFFRKLGHGLFVSIVVGILAEVVCVFLFPGVLGIFDWAFAILFCGYIGYDWVRSQEVPSTLDNAVDCACALYIDIINLFIRVLSIMGKK